jgi:hypothetical protein
MGRINYPVATRGMSGTRFNRRTDARAQKCYRWEACAFDKRASKRERDLYSVPSYAMPAGTFTDRQAAKGFARLCMKIGVRKLAEKHNLSAEKADAIRADFKVRMTKDNFRFCLGGLGGVYFAAWGWDKATICHEVAHFVDHWEREIVREYRTGHSPEWLGWHVFLLVEAGRFDKAKVIESLSVHRLRWASQF